MKKIPGDFIISHKCTINDNHMMYDSWDMKCNTEFLVILGHFLPFHPTNHPKTQNFGKMKKILEDSIILDKCTKNNYYMLCCSWDMAHNICNCYFSFWAIFCLFTSLAAWKIKIKKKHEKKYLEISSFTIVYEKSWLYAMLSLRYGTLWMYLSSILGHFLPFYPSNSLKNQNLKKWKKYLKISSFYTSVPKIMIICYTVPEIWHVSDVIVIFHFGWFFSLLPP